MAYEPGTTEKIIAAAEKRMREGGYHSFSYREIAADVGIKSASVHHHFPTKEDLGAAVAKHYTDRFMGALGDPDSRPAGELLAHHQNLFRTALTTDRKICLCGMLGSEALSLPDRVRNEVRAFFVRDLEWLEAVVRRKSPEASADAVRAEALQILATLEGAMMISSVLGDSSAFDATLFSFPL